jgi:hypothetical protein
VRDSFGTWVYETYGVEQVQEWPGRRLWPGSTRSHGRRWRPLRQTAEEPGLDNVVELAGRRRRAR